MNLHYLLNQFTMKKKCMIVLLVCIVFAKSNAQSIVTIAGGGTSGLGDGGPATAAQLLAPYAGAFDARGNFYFAEAIGSPRVRMIDPSGIIHTVAGNGVAGFSGDGGPATAAKINLQWATVDAIGNLYIGDYYNYRIRKVDAVTQVINTIAGTGSPGVSGSGGPATAANMMPSGICLDKVGNIYFVDGGGYYVRKINTSGIITTVAGTGTGGFAGDGGPATAAQLAMNNSLAIDSAGNLYLNCDTKIRKVDITTNIISTYAGAGITGFSGDGGPATAAQFDAYQIGMDTATNNLYIADYGHDRVYQIDATGIFHWIAGTGTQGFSGDGGPSTAAQLYNPEGVTVDSCGNLFIADDANNRIRKVLFYPSCTVAGHSLNNNSILNDNNSNVSVYPNPTVNQIFISTSSNSNEITITDLIGQQVFRQFYNANVIHINISNFVSGIYLLTVTKGDGQRKTEKILKK
jgi:trimeric autotransporter adhesin